jgi:ActR/RegA family two-component response regulator
MKPKARILLVDDNELLRSMCFDALSANGWQVVPTATGRQALEELERTAYPLACVDLVLPDMGGLAVLSAVRARDPHAKVILMTGFASLDSAVEAVRRGAYDYFRKPFSVADLTAIVEAAHAAYLAESTPESDAERQPPSVPELDGLVALARELQQVESPADALRRIVGAGVDLTQADSGAVLALTPGEGCLQTLCAVGGLGPSLLSLPTESPRGVLAEALTNDGPVCVPDLARRPAGATDPLAAFDVYSLLACPITSEGETQGLLVLLDKYDAPFSRKDEALVSVLAMHAAAPTAELRRNEPAPAPEPAPAGEFVPFTQLFGPG